MKTDTRLTRGVGQYFPFKSQTPIPKDFKDNFFSNNRNKGSFNSFIAEKFMNVNLDDVDIVVPVNDKILSKYGNYYCNIIDPTFAALQEEADMKIIAHILSSCKSGYRKISVKTVDSDAVTLIIAFFSFFQPEPEIEIDFSFGKHRRFFSIHKIISNMREEMRLGSDLTSGFFNISKIAWWKTWLNNHFITETFAKLSWSTAYVDNTDYNTIEKFVCLTYDPNNRYQYDDVDKLRHRLFSTSFDINVTKLPTSRDSLRMHILRSAYIAGWVWGTALNFDNARPSPITWGWKRDQQNHFIVDWSPVNPCKLNYILFTCNCKNECKRCKCVNKNEKCLPFCKCGCNADKPVK